MKTLGEMLREARKAQNMTQIQLAQRINVARTTISNWEISRSQPDYESLRALSDVLQCDFMSINGQAIEEQEKNQHKLRLKLSDSSHIEVISPENACNFTAATVDFRIFGSDSRGIPVEFHVFADFCVRNTEN